MMKVNYRDVARLGMKKEQTLAFTGHRPGRNGMPGYEKAPWQSVVDSMVDVLLYYATEKGIRWFVTGGAQGVDQTVFWAVHKLKASGRLPEGVRIYNVLFMPFEGQELRWKETGIFSRQEYALMVKCADAVVVCGSSDGTFNSATAALTARNQCMLDVAGTVAAFDNTGNPGGGTGDMVRRVRRTQYHDSSVRLDFIRYTESRIPVVFGVQEDGSDLVTVTDGKAIGVSTDTVYCPLGMYVER